jgi:hypothetical protein
MDRGDFLGLISDADISDRNMTDIPVGEYSIDNMATKLPGGIIVLELNINDYSLAQIARIVEDNDAKIMGSYITFLAGSAQIEVILKINRIDATSILQSFRRYGYTIKASSQNADRNQDILRDNYDQFMMYLNV